MAKPSKTARTSDEAKAIGLAIKAMRRRHNLTQEAAAEAAGVTRTAWQNYEAGRPVVLRIDLQDQLARAVGGDREELMIERARISIGVSRPARAANDAREGGKAFETASDRRQAVFPLAEGEVILTYPADLSAEGLRELDAYLAVFLRRNVRSD